jgi:glycine oxidase
VKKALVVGHGLAGSIITHTLSQNGIETACIDSDVPNSASKVGTGLINPFIGPKLNIPNNLECCLIANNAFFDPWNKLSDIQLYFKEPLFRLFKSNIQKKRWHELSNLTSSKKYTHSFLPSEYLEKEGILCIHGGGHTHAMRLDIPRFLKLSKEVISNQGKLENREFCEEDIKDFDIIVFAEGYNVINNPWFNHLHFAPAQGEIMEFTGSPTPSCSNGTWFIRSLRESFLAGSTWKHEDFESGPSKTGEIQICENLKYLDLKKFRKIGHTSGIRSCTIDRNPIIGEHPTHKNLLIFNGFGSRGTTTINYCAKLLLELITQNKPIPEHLNINRFAS